MTTSPKSIYFNEFARSVIPMLPIRNKTRSTYISSFTRHIEPVLASKLLHEVERADIHRVIAPLSPQLAATTLAVLKTLYREGIASQIVDSSPAHGVSGPRVVVSPRKFLTWEDLSSSNFGKYSQEVRPVELKRAESFGKPNLTLYLNGSINLQSATGIGAADTC